MNFLKSLPSFKKSEVRNASNTAELDLWIIEKSKQKKQKKREPLELPRLNPPELMPPPYPDHEAQPEKNTESTVIVFDI